MTDGTEVIIRPICPDDEPLMVWFHETLSDETVYLRYFHPMKLSKRVSHERLTRICDVDYETEMGRWLRRDYAPGASGRAALTTGDDLS